MTPNNKRNETPALKEHEKHIYVSDVSSVSISFRDAPEHTMEEIVRTFKAADRINNLTKKSSSGLSRRGK